MDGFASDLWEAQLPNAESDLGVSQILKQYVVDEGSQKIREGPSTIIIPFDGISRVFFFDGAANRSVSSPGRNAFGMLPHCLRPNEAAL